MPCVCPVIDHRWHQNVVRTKKWHTRSLIVLPHIYTSVYIMHSTHYLYSDWPKAYSVFSKSALGTSSTSRLYNDHVKDTQGYGWSCHVWTRFLTVTCQIRAHFVLLADFYILTRLKTNYQFPLLSWPFFRSMCNKTIIMFLWYPE